MIDRFRRVATITAVALTLLGGASPSARADVQGLPERLTVAGVGVPLAVWSRRAREPRAAVVLVHGQTWSALPDFDLEPPSGSRSLLQALARAGFAAYAVDLPGYGASPRDASGWLTPTRAAENVEAVLRYVAQRHTGLPPPVLFGWSRGSKISALVATRSREPLGALVLYAFNLDPNAPPPHGPASGAAPGVANTAESARSDFVSPDVASPAVIAEFVRAALAADPVQAAVCCDAEFLTIRPESIHVPALMIYGARDPAFKPQVASAFFDRLATWERRWIIVALGDHAAHLEDTGPEVTRATIDFIRAALGQAERPH